MQQHFTDFYEAHSIRQHTRKCCCHVSLIPVLLYGFPEVFQLVILCRDCNVGFVRSIVLTYMLGCVLIFTRVTPC